MNLYDRHISTLRDALRWQDYYDSVKQLFEFDMWQTLPPAGRPFRGEIAGFLTKQAKAQLLSPAVADAVEYFSAMPQQEFREIRHWGAARRFIRLYRQASRVPDDLEAALVTCSLENQMIWREALKASDFDIYRPHMKRLFELKREVAQAVDPDSSPFQVMVDQFDQGLKIEDITRLFDELKWAIPTMLSLAEGRSSKADPTLLSVVAERSAAERFMADFMAGRGDERNRPHVLGGVLSFRFFIAPPGGGGPGDI